MIKFYRVTPHSVLFFRDPRPFTAGEQALARLQFPPRLSPFLGAIRTKYLEEKAGGKPISALFPYIEDDLKQISIFWFSLLKNGTPLIPAPCDLFTSWKKLDESRFVTERLEVNGKFENPKVPLLNPHKSELFESVHYLTPQGFAKYQNGELPSKGEYFSLNDLWEFENRVGIGFSYETKTTERSKFYRITVARPKKGVGFLVGVEFSDSIELPEIFDTTFTTRLGGEGHIAVWEKMDDGFDVHKTSGYLTKFVALTHIPLKSGDSPLFEIFNWCIHKTDIVSGWDYNKGAPKPLLKTAKPGSVFLVKKLKGARSPEFYEIRFGNGITLSVAKDMSLSKNGHKFNISKFKPQLGEPNTVLVANNETIKNIKIKNFRSFREIEMERFGRINVFIGKNNLGKSSVLEALYLSANGIDIVHPSPLWHIMRRRGLASEIQNVPFEVAIDYLKSHFFYKSADKTLIEIMTSFGRYHHEFVFEEETELLKPSDFANRYQDINRGSIRFLKKLGLKGEFYVVGILYYNKTPSILLLEDERTNSYKIAFIPAHRHLTDYFKFFLDTCMLCESSHRISEIIKKLEPKLDEGVYNELKSSLSEYFDEKIKSIELSFADLYVNTETARIPFSMLGDGLRYFTLHYLVLNLRKPSFIFFEEPENYLHPRMMDPLIQAIIQSKHQIFIVTHSIEFLQRLFWKAKVNGQDLKVFGFYGLSDGVAEVESYTLEQAYTSFNKLEVDLR